MVFFQKWPFFQFFFFRQYRPGKCLSWNSRAKKRLSRLQKQEVQGVENWHFSKGVNPWFWSNNGHFSNFFFFVNIDQENVFYDILEQKIRLLGYKKIKIEKAKNWHFSKGVNQWLLYKNGRFSNLFFYAVYARKMSFLIF